MKVMARATIFVYAWPFHISDEGKSTMVERTARRIQQIAEAANNHRMTIKLLAVNAVLTKEKERLVLATSTAQRLAKTVDQEEEALSIIAKVLAAFGFFDWAREVASIKTGNHSHFWQGDAWIGIYKFSRQESDKNKAEQEIGDEPSKRKRGNLLHELKLASEQPVPQDPSVALAQISAVLESLKTPSSGHHISKHPGLHDAARSIVSIFPK